MINRPIDMRKLARVAVTVLVAVSSLSAYASITGTIVDSDAKPVAGATIRAFASEDSRALRARLLAGNAGRDPVATAQSSETGAFSIDAKAHAAVDLVIEAEGHPGTTLATVDGDDLGVILLSPPATSKFRVTSGGKAVANAIVLAGTEVFRTNAAGEVAGFGNGSVFVVHPDYAIGSRSDMGNGASSVYEIKLSRGVAVHGRVVNAAGPVPHAVVSINGWPLAEAAEDGTFSIMHAPESWQSASAVRGNEIGVATRTKTGTVEIRLAAGAAFTGTLLDTKSGAAVGGARMSLSSAEDRSPMTVISDAKGKFTFAPLLPHTYQIEGAHPAYSIESGAVVVPHVSTRAFSALPFARARGRVIDEEKNPVAGVIVNAPSTNGARRLSALTSAAGQFVLRVMAPQSPFALPIYAAKRGYAGGMSESHKWQPGEVRDNIIITLPLGFVTQVRVVDQKRQPVAHAFVSMTRTGENGQQGFFFPAECADSSRPDCRRTGADGVTSFRTSAGPHAVFVTGDDVAPKRIPNQSLTARSEPVVVQVDRGVEISGHVVRADGTPVVDAIVEMPSANMAPRRTTSDAAGAFTLAAVPAGGATVTALSADRRLSSPAVSVTAPAKDVTITMPRGARIEGRVIDRASKLPVADFTIALPSRGKNLGVIPQQFHADDGAYGIDNVTPGMVQIAVSAAGYVPGSRSDIAAEDGKTVSGIDVQLDRGASVSGRVTAGGAPVAGVQVQVSATRNPVAGSTSTDADGGYTIDSLAEGDRTLQFQKTGFIVVRKPVEVVAGKELHLDVELDHGRELRGRVVDRTGRGIAGGNVAIIGNNGPVNFVQTEGDGTFVMQGIADGRYRMTARKAGYVSGDANDVEVPQVQPLTFTLDSGATITGRVLGLTPDEMGQVVVTASGGSSRNQTPVDPAGNFTLHGLPDGSVRVDAFLSGQGRRRMAPPKMIVVENGTAAPVEINFDEGMSVSGHVTHAGVALSMGNVSFLASAALGPPGSRLTNRRMLNAMISPDGSYFVAGLESGDYDVRVNGPGLSFQTKYTASGSGTFDIDIRGAMMRGRVVDAASGAPVANVLVTVSSRAPVSNGSATSDSEGHFAIDALADATFDLRATREPYSVATQQVVVAGGGGPEVEVRLEKAPAVTFHVVDAVTGAPIDAGLFVATAAHKDPTQATRVEAGVFRAWLQQGSYIATAFARFYVSSTTPFSAPQADVRLAMVHGGQLIIQARSAQVVRMEPATSGVVGPVHEGTNGPYPTMAPGSYLLSVLSANGSVLSSVPVVIVAGETTTIQLP